MPQLIPSDRPGFLKWFKDGLEDRLVEFKLNKVDTPSHAIKLEEFEVQAALHAGELSSVYRGIRTDNEAKLAVKTYNKHRLTRNHRLSVFRERNVLLKLKSTGILGAWGTWSDPSFLFLFIEHAEYGDLGRIVEDPDCTLTENQGIRVFGQIIFALKFLHLHGIIHRNLAPDHCLMFDGGRVKLSGFSAACKATVECNRYVGVTIFTAPEMVDRQLYTESVDWYALGMMINFVLRGWFAFAPAGQPLTKLSAAGDDFIRKLLERDHTKRIGTGQNGIDELLNQPWFDDVILRDIYTPRRLFQWPLQPFNGKAANNSVFKIDPPAEEDPVWEDYMCPFGAKVVEADE